MREQLLQLSRLGSGADGEPRRTPKIVAYVARRFGRLQRLADRYVLPPLRRVARPIAASPAFHRCLEQLEWAQRLLRGRVAIILVLLLGTTITGVGYFLTQRVYSQQAQGTFERPASHYTAAVSSAIDRYLDVFNSIASFMAASNQIDRWEFYSLAENSLPRFPAIQTLSWVPRVLSEERTTYERTAEIDGLFGFNITQRTEDGGFDRASPRPEYFPVFFVEPFEGNEDILGYDLGSDPESRRILRTARDTGQMIATQQVNLLPGTADSAAILTVIPIYGGDVAPKTVQERRVTLLGFTLGVVRIGDLIEASLDELATTFGLDIYLYDNDTKGGETLIYYHPSPLNREGSGPQSMERILSGLHSTTSYDVAGRQWSIVISPTPGHFGDAINPVPWTVAAVGFLFMTWLLQYIVSWSNRTRVIEETVARRTVELRESNDALATEIAERARAEEERLALERELSQTQKMESLGTLAGGIAHEINTPVQYVGENLKFLQESFTDLDKLLEQYRALVIQLKGEGVHTETIDGLLAQEEATDTEFLRNEIPESVSQSLEGIQRITEIVRAVKEFSYPDEMKEKSRSRVDLNHAIATTITVSRNQYKYVADLETDFAPDLPEVPCYPGQFNQVMLNLIVNAAHAIEDANKDEQGKITIATRQVDGWAEVRISDTGTGIPEDVCAKIFDPFFTTKEPGRGTGQGLSISHTIITKKHGGTIAVESEPGVGTTFIIRLPLTETPVTECAA